MEDRNLEGEEARRRQQHERVRSELDRDVTEQIVTRADVRSARAADGRLDDVADRMHERAVRDAVHTEEELDRARGAARGSQVVDYVFFVIYAFLGMRLVLALMAANRGNAFVQFVNGVSEPFYTPFRDIVASPTAPGGYTLALPVLIALGAYLLLHAAINRGLRMVAHRKTRV